VQPLDAEIVEQAHLRVDHVGEGDAREVRSPELAGVGPRRGGATRSVAASQIVGADHEETVGVDHAARADKELPPTLAALLVPALADAGDGGIPTGGVLAAGERVEDQDRVVARRRERAVGLVGERHRAERLAGAQAQRIAGGAEGEEPSLDRTDASAGNVLRGAS
jgi:hypothetical protein